ncbi:hypothetical protein BCV70DRAFT_202952 [Testicularia cyperi]|uniref:BHLH domain-containing protein n=1 Tax=Testicularia cyperi TaxID=1882483 RepID=A0A317XHH2_9BASI|nr:hypothetical protein BCV70DRAFT_202952 [Testicularia cyperi]
MASSSTSYPFPSATSPSSIDATNPQPAMASSSSSEKPADLPPMPVPYEDFQFSLDLPAELDFSDIQFLSSVDRKGGPSNPMTPGLTAHFHGSGSTPHAMFGLDDIQMASRSNSRRGSLSKGSHPASPRVGSSRFSESALRPPPPPDFEPSPGSNLFGSDAFAGGVLSPFGVGTPGATDKAGANGQLFDAREKNMLVNFLEGFEWDFDPSLPEGMPSFAAAAAERASSAAEALGLQLGSSPAGGRGPMPHGGPMMSATPRHMQGRNKVGSPASGSDTATPSTNEFVSSSGTSPHGSYRSHSHKRSLSNKSRNFHQGEADLVNAAFGGGLSEWSSQSQQHQYQHQNQQHSHSHHPHPHPHPQPHMQHHPQQHQQYPTDMTMTGSKRDAGHLGLREADEQTQAALALGSLTGMHAEMFRMNAGLDILQSIAQPSNPSQSSQNSAPGQSALPSSNSNSGKKLKIEHDEEEDERGRTSSNNGDANAGSKRELLTESEKRQNHILSEQRRRNYIREGFKELVVLLDDGRSFGARALGLSSGFGTGVEDEGLDDRTDVEADPVDVLTVGRKKPPKKAKKAGPNGVRQRGKGRGRGGSAGGGAGSKSAVLFQAVDLIRWLDGKSEQLAKQCEELEQLAGLPDPDSIIAAVKPASATATATVNA